MNRLKENWLKIITVGFIGFCLLYFFVILPNQKFEYQKYKDLQEQQAKDKEVKSEESKQSLNNLLRNSCLSSAQSSYLEHAKLNATSKDDYLTWTWNSISAREYVEGQLQSDKNECYKQYPIK